MRTFLLGNGVTWVATLLTASGCVLGIRADPTGSPAERPPARDEAPGPKPKDCGDDCRFVPGYWHWDGGNYEWISGRWEHGRQPVANSQR